MMQFPTDNEFDGYSLKNDIKELASNQERKFRDCDIEIKRISNSLEKLKNSTAEKFYRHSKSVEAMEYSLLET